ncbi:E3 ubiquitin-protein ligase RNF181-like [Pyrus ussuriensis x Pyrus communis]|uniref:RING-type E3 ubiquitin transferase n=1 Tax=Pyrus ussuriensis x Pyrus communis TaxID=2448454 RepID=A0A5N5FKY3_9ROSA|nr:E3 ubiquitin-protein ligase RNF181-like [Pyrus ussuriensis x Pyrus communis]
MYAQFSRYPLSFKEQCHVLTESITSWSVISNMLSQASVPYQVQPSMIQVISSRAREIASHPENMNRKTIRMVVHLTTEQEQLSEDHDQTLVPRTKGTPIEELERVKIEGCGKQCAICLEEMQCGSEAIRTPCSHEYHESCIVKWLKMSLLCPLCRFEMSANPHDKLFVASF